MNFIVISVSTVTAFLIGGLFGFLVCSLVTFAYDLEDYDQLCDCAHRCRLEEDY